MHKTPQDMNVKGKIESKAGSEGFATFKTTAQHHRMQNCESKLQTQLECMQEVYSKTTAPKERERNDAS